MSKVIIRKATIDDMKAVRDLIQEFANSVNLPDGPYGPQTTVEDFKKAGFLTDKPEFLSLVAELNKEVVGFVFYYLIYSSWNGRCMFLEDIHVCEKIRRQGVGKKLFQAVIQEARNNNCCRLDFHVLGWNPAIKFYKSLGANNYTEIEKWQLFRIENDKFLSILEK